MNRGLILFTSLVIAGPAAAQADPASAPLPPHATAAGPHQDDGNPDPDLGQGGALKALRASCREEAKSKSLRGPERFEAISACVVRQRPDLAGREHCRTEGFGKGLRKQELRAFVQDCAKTKG